MFLPYIDMNFCLSREDMVKEAIDYAERNHRSLPTEDDIACLYELLDYLSSIYPAQELPRKEYDETVSWMKPCAGFPEHAKYYERM